MTARNDTSGQVKEDGSLPDFNSGAGQSNTLVVFVLGNKGVFFVNGEFVAVVDLSQVTEAGDISVITGAYSGNEARGAVTRYENFQALQLEKALRALEREAARGIQPDYRIQDRPVDSRFGD